MSRKISFQQGPQRLESGGADLRRPKAPFKNVRKRPFWKITGLHIDDLPLKKYGVSFK